MNTNTILIDLILSLDLTLKGSTGKTVV